MAIRRIDEIIQSIKGNTGIVRSKVRLNDVAVAVKAFSEIADAILEWKGERFDSQAVLEGMMTLINWTYMLDDSLDYTSGILLKGRTGVGKTLLMKTWSEFLKIDSQQYLSCGNRYQLLAQFANVRVVASECNSEGWPAIRRYTEAPCLIIDDIGAEPQIQNSFGNRTSIIADIIDLRNERGLLTFGTTNINKMGGEGGRYDDRTARRMAELFNVKAIKGGFKNG